MANTIKIKRKTTVGKPSLASLDVGELCLVVPDEKLYQKTAENSIILINPTKEYASFYLSTGGLTGQGSVARTVIINETHVNSNPSVFSLNSSEVTVNKAGNYKIDFGCYFNNSTTQRTEYTFFLEINGLQVAGTRSGNYQRGYDSGQESGFCVIVSLNAGDVVRARVNRTDGVSVSGYQDDNGTRLVIEEK